MQLTLVTNFNNSMWTDSYTTAVADWQESDALNLNDGGTSDGACDPADGTIAVCAASYGNTPWIGLAQIWTRGPHIRRALAKMNEDFAPFVNGDAGGSAEEWRQYVMCQELGHDFGLDRQDETFDTPNLGTCMDYTSDPGAPPPTNTLTTTTTMSLQASMRT